MNEWDGKLALAQDGTPSRGEPGEPRRFNTYQRTPSPKLGGRRDMIKGNETRRDRNQKRGIRNEATTERRKTHRNRHRGAKRKMYREIKKEPPGETGGGWPPKPGKSQHSPKHRLIKASIKNKMHMPRTKSLKREQVSSEV